MTATDRWATRRTVLVLAAILVTATAFRLPRLAQVPNGFIPDEANAAYEAWSILETGRDQYGERLPLLPRSMERLNSLYIYLELPSVAIFGLNEWAARVPSCLSGILTVGLLFVLVARSFGPAAGLIASSFLAISPWHVLMSRTGFDWNLLPASATLVVLLGQRAFSGQGSFLALAVAAGLSLYGYAPARLLIPMLVGLVGMLNLPAPRADRRKIWIAVVVLAAFAVPIGLMMLTEEGVRRLAVVSDVQATPLEQARSFLARYVASFSPRFLLSPASTPELHRLRSAGLLYTFEFPLVILGFLRALRERNPTGRVLACWLLAAPLSVIVHRDTPDPILSVGSLPAISALGGIGAAWLFASLLARGWAGKAASSAFALWVAVCAARTTRDVYWEFPVYAAEPWTHGVRETVTETERLRSSFDDVIVDARQKLLGPLILFYSRYDPRVRQVETASLPGRSARLHIGAYHIGNFEELGREAGRHLLWTTRRRGRDLLPGSTPLWLERFPDGRNNYALYAVPMEASPPIRTSTSGGPP